MENCSACPAGQYCSTEGLANPSGPCAAGFFCPFDFSSTTPYAFLCPKVRDIHICFHCFFPVLPLPLNSLPCPSLFHCSYCFPHSISPREASAVLFIINVLLN